MTTKRILVEKTYFQSSPDNTSIREVVMEAQNVDLFSKLLIEAAHALKGKSSKEFISSKISKYENGKFGVNDLGECMILADSIEKILEVIEDEAYATAEVL